MKNIHILPTDKPSKILYNHTLKSFCFQKKENGMFVNDGKVSGASFWSIEKAQHNGFCPQHIYITSDEEIKEGEWCHDIFLQAIFQANSFMGIKTKNTAKKIILTTDQDLIKDGVQAIPDEFLEWFVKNPSCEEVEVGYGWIRLTETDNKGYWISIPDKQFEMQQEKSKQELIIYLDDIRTPIDPEWIVVRNYEEFVNRITVIGLHNIALISLDHDLGPSAMREWHTNVYHNYTLDYNNIAEKTGMDCTKWLVEQWLNGDKVVPVKIHSANAVGASNMMGYINNYKHIHRLEQDCVRWEVPHTV